MKKYKNLKELLKAYQAYLKLNAHYGINEPDVCATNFLTFNSLALGKPEPLAKNKQFDKSCNHFGKTLPTVNAREQCIVCGTIIRE